jgi:hypothetical protein
MIHIIARCLEKKKNVKGRRSKMTYSLYYNQLQMEKRESGEENEIECFFLLSVQLSRVPHKIYNVTIETYLS